MRAGDNRRRGAALVEFAILVPVFVLVVMGIVEYGQFLYAKQAVTLAAREACRIAVLPGTTKEQAIGRAYNVLSEAGISSFQITFDPDPPTSASDGDPITVTVLVDFDQISWLGSPMYLDGVEIRATAVMRREWIDGVNGS